MATNVQTIQATPSVENPQTQTVDSSARQSVAVATTLNQALHEATAPNGRRPHGNAMYSAVLAEASSMDSAQRSQGAGIAAMETTEKQITEEQDALKEIQDEAKNIPSGYSSMQKEMYMTELGIKSQSAELGLKQAYNNIETTKSLQITPNSSDILTASAIGDELVTYNNVIGKTR